jgi:hypothetical protein
LESGGTGTRTHFSNLESGGTETQFRETKKVK